MIHLDALNESLVLIAEEIAEAEVHLEKLRRSRALLQGARSDVLLAATPRDMNSTHIDAKTIEDCKNRFFQSNIAPPPDIGGIHHNVPLIPESVRRLFRRKRK